MTKFLLIIIFAISLLVRAYHQSDDLFFGYEQGRDAIAIRNINTLKDFTLVGPKTDIDGVFHGPWYYYLMAIPYLQSNPLIPSFLLIFMTSFIPIFLYKLTKDPLTALLAALSFEMITYSRWLHHYAFGITLLPLVFLSLWKYKTSNKSIFFITAAGLASFASQFEIAIVIPLTFIFGLALISRFIKLPNPKTIVFSFMLAGFFFLPLIVFNFRHENITLNSLFSYSSSEKNFSEFFLTLYRIYNRSLVNTDNFIIQIIFTSLFIVGLVKAWPNKKIQPKIIFFGIWAASPIALLPFGVYLDQLFLGVGLAFIALLAISIRTLKLLALPIFLFLILAWHKNLEMIANNNRYFFTTIQDDLNYKDQNQLLDFVHADSKGTPYSLKAFTIPYFHSEAWDYLLSVKFPNDPHTETKILYLVIESQVAPNLEKQWIKDLGKSNLLSEQKFGKIRLQKRITHTN